MDILQIKGVFYNPTVILPDEVQVEFFLMNCVFKNYITVNSLAIYDVFIALFINK